MTDIERICRDIRRKLDDMCRPGMWDRYTKNMEGGEYREFVQYYRDLETILNALSGATFETDTNVGGKWMPVAERLPEPFVPVLVQMPMEKPFPTVREGFITNDGIWHSAYYDREPDEVTHWMPLPEPPKEE